MNINNILELFPFEKIRDSQKVVLNEIQQALASGYNKIILEASTGFGKSPVAIAVADYLGSSYICTSTINLQDQYLKDFDMLTKIIGKNNFECRLLEERNNQGMFRCEECETNELEKCSHTTVDKAPCLSKKFYCAYKTTRADYDPFNVDLKEELIQLSRDPARANILYSEKVRVQNFMGWDHYKSYNNNFNPCNYYHQKNIGLLSNHTILNYAIFNNLTQVKRKTGKPYLQQRKLLVLDEGHLFENEVIANNGEDLELRTISNLTRNRIVTMPETDTIEGYLEYLYNVIEYTNVNIDELNLELSNLSAKANKQKINKKEMKRISSVPRSISYLTEKVEKLGLLHTDIKENPDNWVIDYKDKRLLFKPLDITKYCNELYVNASTLLVMSATILDKDMYCKQIGLNVDEVKFISIDSDFPVENKPIFRNYIGKLSKDNIDLGSTHRIIGNKLSILMKEYNDVKGIIHMPTNKLIDQVLPYIQQEQRKRLYVVKSMTSKERAEMLSNFDADPRGVLISPSLYVGIDLKDDLSRFQIIVKIPYPPLGDKWIKKKFDLDKKWYSWMTLLKVVQGSGRSVRHSEDYCDTIILDQNFDNILKYSSHLLPKSFLDALEFGKNNPTYKTINKGNSIV